MSKKYETKSVYINALQFTGDNWEEISDFCSYMDMNNGHMIIKTLEGVLIASVGDFIIKGLAGEFYPCKPDIFHLKYSEVEDVL